VFLSGLLTAMNSALTRTPATLSPSDGEREGVRGSRKELFERCLVSRIPLRVLENTSSANGSSPLRSSETNFITLFAGFISQKRGFISNRRRRSAAEWTIGQHPKVG